MGTGSLLIWSGACHVVKGDIPLPGHTMSAPQFSLVRLVLEDFFLEDVKNGSNVIAS